MQRFGKDQIEAGGKKYRFAVYAYRVRAVNDKGIESGPSPYVLTIPSAPEHLYSKEDGDDRFVETRPEDARRCRVPSRSCRRPFVAPQAGEQEFRQRQHHEGDEEKHQSQVDQRRLV